MLAAQRQTKPGLVLASIGFALGIALALTLWRRFHGRRAQTLIIAALMLLVLGEAGYNAALLSAQYLVRNDTGYQRYVEQAEKQAKQFAQTDGSFYRINQLQPFHTNAKNLTANYNEAAAYGFASLSGYTSDPSNLQLALLDRLGYRQNGDNLCVVNTSLLPVDSLLSVQYVISPIAINGLQPAQGFAEYNRKQTYRNPYRLPMALRYRAPAATSDTVAQSNPFQYQEQLYAQLLGEDVQLYLPVRYTQQAEENALRYTLTLPHGAIALYGNLPWQTQTNGEITVQDTRLTAYACWLSPSVFYVPTEPDQRQTVVRFAGEEASDATLSPQFYALDLDAFAEVAQKLQQKSAQAIEVTNARFTCSTTAAAGESLLVSIPYDAGWSVFRNGQRITPARFADCLYSVPLAEGENRIVMTYAPKGALAGLTLSGFAILTLLGVALARRKRRRNRPACECD